MTRRGGRLSQLSIAPHRLRMRRLRRNHPIAYARALGVAVGQGCRFLGVTEATFGSEPYMITIGDHVTLTHGVEIVTHDGGVWVFREEFPDIDVFAPVVIGSNVFIGLRAIIMPGVVIGDNVIVGAGSIVTRAVPSNSVVAGMPAKKLRGLDEYKTAVLSRAMHIRSMGKDDKRHVLESRYRLLRRGGPRCDLFR